LKGATVQVRVLGASGETPASGSVALCIIAGSHPDAEQYVE
jgi:hypothetical protein